MSEKNRYTKEGIKSRMFNRIATLWDVRSIDELDPVVKLLVESLASEVFKLSADLDTLEDRIVEKMAAAFTPSFMMAASPAHGILHARALSGATTIGSSTEFVYKAPQFIQKYNLRKLVLTPVCDVTLVEGDVTAIIADGRFWTVTPRGGKDHIANSVKRDPVFANTVWVGLELSKGVKSPENLSFYFEFPFVDNKEEYVRLLGHTRWSCQGEPLHTTVGIPEKEEENREGFGTYDPYRHLQEEIKRKYNSQFITVDQPATLQQRSVVPSELESLFDEAFRKELKNERVWIKVVFPPAFDQ